MSRVAVSISVREGGPGGPAALARRLEAMGAAVQEVHDLIGVITCDLDSASIDAVRALPEVEAVEEVRRIQLPPPDAPIQ